MLTPEGGGIPERPLTAIFPHNGLRGRDACRWRFLLINAGGSPLKPWALPKPSRTPGALHPGSWGVAPNPTGSPPERQELEHFMFRLPPEIMACDAVKGRSAIPPPSGVSICSLFPLTVALFVPRRKKCLFFMTFLQKLFFEITY